MHQIDLKQQLKHLYSPSAKAVVQVDVPTFCYVMMDSEGDSTVERKY